MPPKVEVCKADETLNRAALGTHCGSWSEVDQGVGEPGRL